MQEAKKKEREAVGVEADAREIADAVMEKLHPHQRELDSEIEKAPLPRCSYH